MKKIITGIIIVLILAVLIFFVMKNTNSGPKYKTDKIIKGNLTETITASGTVNPVTNISVGTQVSGKISKIYADFNSSVKKGQLLAQIDPSLFETQVEQARANLYNAQANLQKVKSLLINDEKTYSRNKTLFEQDFIARSDVDLAQTNYNTDLAQIASAKAQIAQMSAALRNTETNLRYTRIISPVDGIVVSRNVDIGQTVAASFQTPTLFLVAQDLTKMQIDTNVAEADIGKVKVGQRIEFTVDGYPDITFKGSIKQIRNAPTTIQNVVTYDVVINVNNKDLKLKPGMTANVSIITSDKKNILMASNESLRFTPHHDKDNLPKYKEQGIWILKHGKPKRINIKTGISDGNYTEIISGHIAEGQEVILDTIEKSRRSKGGGGGQPGMRMF